METPPINNQIETPILDTSIESQPTEEQLVLDLGELESLEDELTESEEVTPEETIKVLSLTGRVRNIIVRYGMFFALLGVSGGIGGVSLTQRGNGEQRGNDTVEIERVKDSDNFSIPKYGSSEYKIIIERLRERLKKDGINKFPTDSTLWKMYDLPEAQQIFSAIRQAENDKEIEKEKSAMELKKLDTMPEEPWSSTLNKIGYPDILETESRAFGIKPVRRLGYNRYESFNKDILQITQKLNQRIDDINNKNHKEYPKLTPGFLSAVVLQEGMADIIDGRGYNSNNPIGSFGSIGADSLGGGLNKLISRGLLEPNFRKDIHQNEDYTGLDKIFSLEVFGKPIEITNSSPSSITSTNEKNMRIIEITLGQSKMIEGVGAIILDKIMFITDKVGIDRWRQYSEDEQNWLTYAGYQWGEGNVIKLLDNKALTVQNDEERLSKKIPIGNFVRYKEGTPSGRVQTVSDFIYRNEGRPQAPNHKLKLHDFHSMASIVTVSTKISNNFFKEVQNRYSSRSSN